MPNALAIAKQYEPTGLHKEDSVCPVQVKWPYITSRVMRKYTSLISGGWNR